MYCLEFLFDEICFNLALLNKDEKYKSATPMKPGGSTKARIKKN